jgi:hypothetical protein
MRYHADMKFQIRGVGARTGQVGVIRMIDFEEWSVELEMEDGQRLVKRRRDVVLVDHENCDAPCGCTANSDRTEGEP